MSRDAFGEDAPPYQQIDIIAGPSGWMVSEDGRPRGLFQDIESAYKDALAICNALFEDGVRACVRQSHPLNA